MPDEPTSILPLLISIIVPVLTGVLTYRSTLAGVKAQFAINKIEKEAEAAKDYAEAESTEINNITASLPVHMQAVQELMKRDFELVGLNRRVAELQSQIDILTANQKQMEERHNREIGNRDATITKLEEQLAIEKQLREISQKELAQQREKVQNLMAAQAAHKLIDPTQPIPDLSGEQ